MSKYAKQQEYRVKKILENIPGVAVVKYYGSREKDKGDFLVEVGAYDETRPLRIDHKSTRSEEKIVIEKDWMPRLQHICMAESFEDGESVPVITLSLLNHRQVYAVSQIGMGRTANIISGTPAKRVHLNLAAFELVGNNFVFLDVIDCLPMYLYRLERFIELYRLNY